MIYTNLLRGVSPIFLLFLFQFGWLEFGESKGCLECACNLSEVRLFLSECARLRTLLKMVLDQNWGSLPVL